ncbi:hypothetical protein ACFO6R_02295 [Eubacterium multiforme]|uniref:Chromosome segregation ATPase n=1 Tax=Eubacterium multiforme TaxID=83339 RepID=A0ABT9UP36_9FIRM|nr:hypothetical protein [Eubacterium multiforme]MDQ0148416.1 chromosome segregation ATPase [Eubacterium multiforme]
MNLIKCIQDKELNKGVKEIETIEELEIKTIRDEIDELSDEKQKLKIQIQTIDSKIEKLNLKIKEKEGK